MRLHSLTLAAIGPFAGEHRIDFAALGASGLFLLEGPTGAGKSTVIDAVVFALYGRPAALSASPDRLRSSHAAPGTAPVVDLVFETAAGVYRVRRSPEFTRPKQRGTGTTREQASVRLWRLADPDEEAGEPLSTRVGEADAELLRVVGLSREQFVQTVVLPQGEFAAFLRATPDERRPVLQRLFGTEVYQRMQDHLAEAARGARRSADLARAGVRSAIEAFVRTAHEDAASSAPDGAPQVDEQDAVEVPVDLLSDRLALLAEMGHDPEGAKVVALVEDITESLHDDVARRDRSEDVARAEEAAARRTRDEATGLAERLTTRATLHVERERLAARAPAVTRLEDRVVAARRAAAVVPVSRQAARAREEAADAATSLSRRIAALTSGRDHDLASVDAEALGSLRSDALREQGSLDRMIALEADVPRRRAALTTHEEALTDLRRRHSDLAADLAARPAAHAVLVAELTALRERALGAESAALRLERAEQVLAASRENARLSAEREPASAVVSERARRAQAAIEHEGALRRRRVDGLAGELAEALRAGEGCPVCGATEHPSPARSGLDAVTPEDIAAAERARAAAEDRLAQAHLDLAVLDERLRAAAEAACGRSSERALAIVVDRRADLARAEAAASAVRDREMALAEHEATTLTVRAEHDRLGHEMTGAVERLVGLQADLSEDVTALEAARGTWPSVEARARVLAERARAAEDLQGAHRRAAQATARLVDAEAQVAQALAEAGFPAEGDALAAALTPAALDEAEREVDAHRRALAQVEGALADPRIADLTGEESPDVDGAATVLSAASDRLLAATRAAERARTRLVAVERDARALREALGSHAAAAARAAPLVHISGLANAGEANDRRTTLATYVLLRRFEDVVAAANVRLGIMSDGRFALERTDDREGGTTARKAGLGLAVADALTGDRRNPRTLSGGETFYVSLCLALGLADVVTAEAGGIDLGTLFIDEGFGSLDPDTLDAVLGELARLRSGGRVVGIVSHVTELKQQIAERIEVRRLPDGSSALTVRA